MQRYPEAATQWTREIGYMIILLQQGQDIVA